MPLILPPLSIYNKPVLPMRISLKNPGVR